ncbi:MAG TPA: sulfatase [Puia sp.]|nr:sulfatase [Puia sp.]
MKKFLLLLIICCSSFLLSAQENISHPNIIIIFSDDHAYQATSVYGNKIIQTPNIDRLAKEGAVLLNNFVTNSICGPSRATLLTGKYSHVNGYKFNERKFDFNQQVFPALLQQSGYQTAWIGKLHLGNLPYNGFNDFNILPDQGEYYNPDFINYKNDTLRHEGYVTDLITKFSEDWLNNRDTSKPFFLVIGEKATHREWLPSLEDLGAFDNIDFPLPSTFFDNYENRLAAKDQDMTIDKTMRLNEDLKIHLDFKNDKELDEPYSRFTPEQQKVFAAYYDKISKEFDEKKLSGKELAKWKFERYLKDYYATAKSLDRNIGKILDYLDKNNLSKNTVVIYASDQGFYLGEHGWFDKRFMYEESLRSAFIIRYPDIIKPGTKLSQFISNVDWAPTLLDIAHTKIPDDIQGISFLKLLNKKKDIVIPWRNEVYYHYYEFPEPHHVHPHFGIRTEKYKLIYFYEGMGSWELYDLTKDPNELNNIYGKKENEKIIFNLKTELKKLMTQYKDKEALKILSETDF